MKPIWIVDDDQSIRFVLEKALLREDLPTRSFTNTREVLAALEQAADDEQQGPQVLVSDIRMPGGSGLDLLDKIKAKHPGLPVIIMTAFSDLDSAVSAFQGGAFEYLPKPFDLPRAVELIRRAVDESQREEVAEERMVAAPEMLGQAPAMQDVFRAIGETARSSPWFTVGGKGAVVRTAQIRVRLILKVNGVEGLLGNLVTLPLYVDIAQAKGELAALSCSTGRPESLRVTVDTTPGVADLRIADIDAAAMSDFGQAPAMSLAKIVNVSLLGLGLISVSGQARAAVESSRATALTFSYGDIRNRVVKSASTQNLVGSLTSSLFGSLQLEARLAGLKITVPASVTAGLGKTLGSVAQPVDGLLNTLLKLLGARVGYADVRVNGATCTQSVLVQ